MPGVRTTAVFLLANLCAMMLWMYVWETSHYRPDANHQGPADFTNDNNDRLPLSTNPSSPQAAGSHVGFKDGSHEHNNNNKQVSPSVLLIGAAGSGAHDIVRPWLAELFVSSNLSAVAQRVHALEWVEHDCSFFAATNRCGGVKEKLKRLDYCRTLLRAATNITNSACVIHVVRHPLTSIQTLVTEHGWMVQDAARYWISWNECASLYARATIPRNGTPDIPATKFNAGKGLGEWLRIRARVRAEDADLDGLPNTAELCVTRKLPEAAIWTRTPSVNISSMPNTFDDARLQRLNATLWPKLSRLLDSATMKRLKQMMEEYGYAPMPPRTVILVPAQQMFSYHWYFKAGLRYFQSGPLEIIFEPLTTSTALLPGARNTTNWISFGTSRHSLLSSQATVTWLYDEYCSTPSGKVPGSPEVIFRPYYFDKMERRTGDRARDFWFPLGIRSNFPGVVRRWEIRPASERKYLFNYIVSLDTDEQRLAALRLLRDDKTMPQHLQARGFVHAVQAWTDWKRKLDGLQYKQVLLQSAFTISPFGHNPWSFRIFEAMEAGSIPIIGPMIAGTKSCADTFRPLRDSGAPVLYVNTWEELPALLLQHQQNPELTQNLQERMVLWYDRFRTHVVHEFARLCAWKLLKDPTKALPNDWHLFQMPSIDQGG